MKAYIRNDIVVATHDDWQLIAPQSYGDGVRVLTVPNGTLPGSHLSDMLIEIDTVKASLKTQVDQEAEMQRLKYITSGSGQAMTYQQKADEARRYLASDDPDEIDYPILGAEVGITAPDMNGVASVVLGAYAQWQQIGAAIEAVRLGGKAAIEAASSPSQAQEAFDAIIWPAGDQT